MVETDDVPNKIDTIEVTTLVTTDSEYEDLDGNIVLKLEGIKGTSGYKDRRIIAVNLTNEYEIGKHGGGTYWRKKKQIMVENPTDTGGRYTIQLCLKFSEVE